MQNTYDRQTTGAPVGPERALHLAQIELPTLPNMLERSFEDFRAAVADLLSALSGAFQERPEEAYGYITRAVSLLKLESPAVASSSQLFDTYSAPQRTLRGGLAPWQMRRVSSYIETHMDLPIGTRDLAALAKQSIYHFSRTFRTSFGESPHTYLMRRRIERAQGMMLQTNSPIAQIAIECGMSDQAHLTKSFRRFVGETPAAWRRARTAAPP
jgi:AraC family transcriptional regulator